jgi:hypothetical protein
VNIESIRMSEEAAVAHFNAPSQRFLGGPDIT